MPGRPEDQMQGDRGLDFLLTETYTYRSLSEFGTLCKWLPSLAVAERRDGVSKK